MSRISKRTLLKTGFKRRHIKPVAHQDGNLVAETGVDRRAITASVGIVNNVVVNERRRMQHFHHGRHPNRIFPAAVAADRVVCQNIQRRAHVFAARLSQIIAEIIDNLNI